MPSNIQQQGRGLMIYPAGGWRKALFKAPLWLWRLGLGPILGRFYLVLTTVSSGANTGRKRIMSRRSKDWNLGLAQDLRNPVFAREFLMAAIEEGVTLQHALGKVIRAMGVKEFAAKVHMASPNLLRVIDPRSNPTQESLNRLLRPFRLRLSLAQIEAPKRRRAA